MRRRTAPDLAVRAVFEDEILLVLQVRGALVRSALSSDVGLGAEHFERAIAALLRRGEVIVAHGPEGSALSLSTSGREAASAAAARERSALAADLVPRFAAFAALDEQVKSAITRWQVRNAGGVSIVNDHRDRAYDATILAELRALCAAAVRWLEPLGMLRSRYRRYAERLAAAAERAATGDRAWVCGLRVDSVHSVWWQIHADLRTVLGCGHLA